MKQPPAKARQRLRMHNPGVALIASSVAGLFFVMIGHVAAFLLPPIQWQRQSLGPARPE
jgi:hypothetical protein